MRKCCKFKIVLFISITSVLSLTGCSTINSNSKTDIQKEEVITNTEQQSKELINTESNISEDNISQEEPVNEYIKEQPQKEEFNLEEYQKELNTSFDKIYDNKDVQYDRYGHLDKEFGFIGYAQLSDYYNYAFSGYEDNLYCVRVTPANGGDDWYLYYMRPSYLRSKGADESLVQMQQENFDALLNNQYLPVYVIATLRSDFYEDNRGNMANGLLMVDLRIE